MRYILGINNETFEVAYKMNLNELGGLDGFNTIMEARDFADSNLPCGISYQVFDNLGNLIYTGYSEQLLQAA